MAAAFVDHVINRLPQNEPRLRELSCPCALKAFGDAQRQKLLPMFSLMTTHA
jgi:hypothetical protein